MLITPSDIVLEIGSGGDPFSRADVLVDKFLEDEAGERHGQPLYLDRRPLLIADAERLPFVDKAFDYIYCKHMIEHALDIERMICEISRVGRAGYLEFPHPMLEKLLNEKHHRWYITLRDKKLAYLPKTPQTNISGVYDRFYFHLLASHRILDGYWKDFTVRFEWQGQIEYQAATRAEDLFFDVYTDEYMEALTNSLARSVLWSALKLELNSMFKRAVKKSLHPKVVDTIRKVRKKIARFPNSRLTFSDLERYLQCPYCTGSLSEVISSYRCNRCNRQYPIQNGIPVFL